MASSEKSTTNNSVFKNIRTDSNVSDELDLFHNIDPIVHLNNNQNPDLEAEEFSIHEDFLEEAYLDFYGENSIFNQLSEHSIAVLSNVDPPSDASYSTSFIELILNTVKSVNEAALTETALNFDDKQPSFDSIIDYNDCASDLSRNEGQSVEHSRRDHQNQFNNEIPLQLSQKEEYTGHVNLNQPSSESFTQSSNLFHLGGLQTYFDTKQDIEKQEIDVSHNECPENVTQNMLLNDRHHNLLDNQQLHMFEDDHSKDFSSWFCFDSDDENELTFFKKSILDEKEYTYAHFSNKRTIKSAAEDPIENNNVIAFSNQSESDGCKKPNSKEHVAPEPLPENVSSNTQHKDSNTELFNSKRKVDTLQKFTKTNVEDQKKPHAITNDTFSNDDFSFKDTIINTSTPTISRHQSVTYDQVIQKIKEESPIRETRRSKYFIRNNRSISIAKGSSS